MEAAKKSSFLMAAPLRGAGGKDRAIKEKIFILILLLISNGH